MPEVSTEIRARVRAYLAAEMWVPCGKCEGGIHYIIRGDYELSCGPCQGSGKQFLLRKDCSLCRAREGFWIEDGQGATKINCAKCGGDGRRTTKYPDGVGLGYLFDDSPDALWDAVREKGWTITHWSYPNEPGDTVSVDAGEVLRMVSPAEELRGQAAIELALARALGWQ